MSGDEWGRRLHDKGTRGEALSAEEQAQLEQWYERQDQEEAAALAAASPSPAVASLQTQLDAALTQLVAAGQRIQKLTAENEAVRREIAALQRRLAEKPTKQPA